MTSYKVNSYLNLLGKTPEYENLFSLAHQLRANQLTFAKLVPAHLAKHCNISRISNGRLIIMVENGAIASKLKQYSPSLLLKLQALGWEVTAIQILVQAHHLTKNTKPLAEQGCIKRKIKLSQTAQDCLDQLAATLPESELRDAIQLFLKKHQSD
ncbi:DUF721 domain-containing protein [Nitrosomonas sp. Nm166]|uniref:DUF721 domain-containing protein n=1 Tax=Nitrosomonas sp. Nm166 TaxID=1881054 RepID=UPI0008EB65EA|nr:DUF721 domain-containing protein [Nitrosomonas sp. Nm166]SFE97746.1 Protein of unknown function [Nitrosomonas sp. Nm166]